MPRGDEVYSSPWLKAADLVDDEATFTISRSDITEFKERDGKTKKQIYLEFEETEKPLGLNKTNYGVLQSIFRSPETDDWIGKKVVLFVTQCQMPDGSTGDCIRIKRKATEAINAKSARPRSPAAREFEALQARPAPELSPEQEKMRDETLKGINAALQHGKRRATQPVTQEEVDADNDIPF